MKWVLTIILCCSLATCGNETSQPHREAIPSRAPTHDTSVQTDAAIPKDTETNAITHTDTEDTDLKNWPIEEKTIAMEKTRMRLLLAGPQDGIPIMLIHGATFRAELWKTLGTIEFLTQRGFRVAAPDLPGHGKSGKPAGAEHRYITEMLKAADFSSSKTKPFILGHSYAGAYMLPFIAGHAEQLSAAILVAPVHVKKWQQKLKGNPIKALVVWGDKDEMISVSVSHRLVRTLPNSQLVLIPDAMHECYNKDIEYFHQLILNFVEAQIKKDN